MAITWYVMTSIIVVIISALMDSAKEVLMSYIYMLSILMISASITASYFFKLNFLNFLIVSYSFWSIVTAISLISLVIAGYRRKNNTEN